MRVVVDTAGDPAEQMRRDREQWAIAEERGVEEPTLRLFQFAPAGITLGASQDPAQELDTIRCARDGIVWAVRPTGGRALFHAQEWTFTLIARLGPSGWALDGRAAYARTCTLIASAFTRLGVPVEQAVGSPRSVGAPRRSGACAPPCFASTARHELLLDGRKFAGVAQRVSRGLVLQQGSLLLGPGHERLADYVAVPDDERERARATLVALSAEAGGWLGSDLRLERLRDAILAVATAPVRQAVAAPVEHRPTAPPPRGMLHATSS